MEPAAHAVLGHVAQHAPGDPVGLYLTGSSVAGGLRPDSDVDLLLVTARSLTAPERTALELLLRHSGRRATVRPGRPVELVSLVLGDVSPWRYPAVRDFLYGEWLREDHEAGRSPERQPDPNLPVLVTQARTAVSLVGPDPASLLPEVPVADLRRGVRDGLPDLVADVYGDERNVLLTLARMLVTVRTGRIASKDDAALEVAEQLPPTEGQLVTTAARAYRGEVGDHWDGLHDEVAAAVHLLVELIEADLSEP